MITWWPPEDDGGSSVTSYIIQRKQLGGTWGKCGETGANEYSYKVTGLKENETYNFRVVAKNKAGQGLTESDACLKVIPSGNKYW